MNQNQTLPNTLYTAAQVRELDRRAIQERIIPGYLLMNRAGEAVFTLLRERWPSAQRIGIVCGSGNNAGDGYVIARLAQQSGLQPLILTLKDPTQLSDDALTAFQDARACGVSIQAYGDDD